MAVTLTKFAALIMFIAINGSVVSRVMGQQTSESRTRHLAVIKYSGDMASLLPDMARTYGMTIGFEVDAKRPSTHIVIDLRDPTLPDVLNAIVTSASIYKWREQGEFIEVLPLEASNPLLDTMIRNFQVSDVYQTEAVNLLLLLPEVQANMRAMSLTRRDNGSASSEATGKGFSVKLENVTLRQVLSSIANASGSRVWTFRVLNNGSFSISFSSD